jgi:hypothetical protein
MLPRCNIDLRSKTRLLELIWRSATLRYLGIDGRNAEAVTFPRVPSAPPGRSSVGVPAINGIAVLWFHYLFDAGTIRRQTST